MNVKFDKLRVGRGEKINSALHRLEQLNIV